MPTNGDLMATPYSPNTLYMANPAANTESLLTDASETLQGIAQVVMVAEMAVNRVLDQLVPTE
jgi:hypothetical protein